MVDIREKRNVNEISCVCIDDEPFALATIEEYCSRVPWLTLIGSFTDAVAAVECIKNDKPQVIFLDIQMPDIGGLQIARNVNYQPEIVFTTAFSQYAVEGFELDATDYLLKPYSFDRFLSASEKIRKRIGKIDSGEKETVQLKSAYKTVAIAVDEILYIEALDSYSVVVTLNGKTIVHHQLKCVLDLLPNGQFMRVHRSFIVNRDTIKSFTKSQIDIGERFIPVGRSYAKDFAEYMGRGR